MVAKHLTKLFDSMAKLMMEEDGEGKATNTAHTMVAKDGEKVLFKVACICEGQVEVWLNRLMSCMRETIRQEFNLRYKKINVIHHQGGVQQVDGNVRAHTEREVALSLSSSGCSGWNPDLVDN